MLLNWCDVSTSGSSSSNLIQIGTGHYRFDLSPDNPTVSANLSVTINGSGIKSATFGDSFEDANLSFAYNPNTIIFSSDVSHWARGYSSGFSILTQNASSLTVDSLPSGLEFNSSSKTIFFRCSQYAGTFRLRLLHRPLQLTLFRTMS